MTAAPLRSSLALTAAIAITLNPPVSIKSAALDIVKVRTTSYPSMAALYVALGAGFFAEQGLQIEPVEMMSGATLVPALLRGDIDVLPIETIPALFNSIARGGRLRIVGSQMQYVGACAHGGIFTTRAFAQSGALERADLLRGRTYSMSTFPASMYLFDQALKPLGLSTNDLTAVDVPDSARIEALRTGRLDLAMMTEPTVMRATRAGDVMWKSTIDLAPKLDYSVIVFGPTLLDSRPGVGQRFMTAYLRGVRQYVQGKTARNLDLLVTPLGLDRETLTEICWPPVSVDGQINTAALMAYEQWLAAKGAVDRLMAPAEIIDARFLGSETVR